MPHIITVLAPQLFQVSGVEMQLFLHACMHACGLCVQLKRCCSVQASIIMRGQPSCKARWRAIRTLSWRSRT